MDDLLNYLHITEHEFLASAKAFAVSLLIAGSTCFFIERNHPAESKTPFLKKDFGKELVVGTFNALVFLPVFTAITSSLVLAIMEDHVPYQAFSGILAHWPIPAQILFGVFILDLSTYWRHRLSHRFWWSYHAFHHSAEEVTWLTALRMHPVDYFFVVLFDTIVLYVLGFDGIGIVAAIIVTQGYNYFIHANLKLEFSKPLRYLLASPHYHRWHHANEKAAYDKNFCGVFPVLDLAFGTYNHPEDVLPQAYGLLPQEQVEVPRGLIAHLWQPVRKNLKKLAEE